MFKYFDCFTPYNVGSVLWRLFSTIEVVQYIGGITSVLCYRTKVKYGVEELKRNFENKFYKKDAAQKIDDYEQRFGNYKAEALNFPDSN